MDIIKISLENIVRDWLTKFVSGNLDKMAAGINNQTGELAGIVMARPSDWNPGIWGMISGAADVVIVPIAAGILTYVMCMELISWAQSRNNLNNGTDVIKQLLLFVVKLGIGVMLVSKAKDITLGIFDLGAWAVSRVAGIETGGASITISLGAVKDQLAEMDLGALLGLTFTSLLGGLGIQVVSLVARVIVVGRMLEIYIYCSMGSAPYATLMNPKLSNIGANYIKNLLALAFQGFFIFLMLGIYSVMIQGTMNDISSGSKGVEGLIAEMCFISFVLVKMIMQSKPIAKSIFSAQ